MYDKEKDDGSLAFLKIPRDKENRSFNCKATSQSRLVNTTFWVMDFLEDVPTVHSRRKGTEGRTLVRIAESPDAPESETQKFFTGSSEMLYVLRKIREMDAFPRRVTLRAEGNRYYLE